MSTIKLNNVDLAWFRMDKPTNPMMITVVMKMNGQINYDQFIKTLDVSLGRYRRFKQRIVQPHGLFQRPYWENVPNYRVEDHVERVTLQSPGDEICLQELVSQKMNTVLDYDQPLWKMTLVDNYAEGTVIISRVHHVIADGVSLMQVLMQTTKKSPDEPANQVQVDDPKGEERQAVPAIPPLTMPVIGGGQSSSKFHRQIKKNKFFPLQGDYSRDYHYSPYGRSNHPNFIPPSRSAFRPQKAAEKYKKSSLVNAVQHA